MKNKTAIRRFRSSKSNRNEIKSGTMPWELKSRRKVNSKFNGQIKKSLYNWIMHHPKVVQSPIFNYCLKVKIDGHTRPQIVSKMLLQVSVWELRNILVSDPEYGGLKEEIDVENNIIISDSTLRSLFPPQLKTIQHDTRSCGVFNVIYLPKL